MAFIAATVSLTMAYFLVGDVNAQELSYQEFKTKYLDTGRVERLVVETPIKRVKVYLRNQDGTVSHTTEPAYFFYIGSIESFDRQLESAQHDVDPRDYVNVKYITRESVASQLISLALPIGLLVAVVYFSNRAMSNMGGGGGKGKNIFSIGKAPVTMVKPGEMTKTTFKDVAGLDDAKIEVMEFVK
jgi:AFG3 family protein